MSFDDRLIHSLVVKRMTPTTDPPTLDEYGQPVTAAATVATVKGLVQPRRAREVALASQAGVVLGEYAGYLRPLAGIGTDCWIERDGVRYDVLFIGDAGGVGHHLELGLKQVT